ncbi:hypothetical protein [Chitinophaga sp.]|uniref:hypothetical protein n=1 Tax=Chitinophaga sp. TaxID=1869181 RepID=UPI0031E0F332
MTGKKPISLNDREFLFSWYTPQDIDIVIDDFKRTTLGVRFVYAIDTFDMVENYLPYFEKNLFSEKNIEHRAHKYICYDHFFGSHSDAQSVLLDEYKLEFLFVKKKLSKHLADAARILDNLKSLREITQDFTQDLEKVKAFFESNLEFILAMLIINKKQGNILTEFVSFLTDRLDVYDFKNFPSELIGKLRDIFEDSVPSGLSVNVFRKYIDKIKLRLLAIEDPQLRNIYLDNTYRDIRAIERVVKIDKKIRDSGLKCKVIYFSTAKKTEELVTLCKHELGSTFVNIHRNIYHYFLLKIISRDYQDNVEKGISVLNAIKENFKARHSDVEYVPGNSNPGMEEINTSIDQLFRENANVVDNHFYLKLYDQYNGIYNLDDQPQGGSVDTRILDAVKELESNWSELKGTYMRLDQSISRLNQTISIKDVYSGLVNYDPVYKFGCDTIRDPFHHLPYLLDLNVYFTNEQQEIVYGFLNLSAVFKNPDKKRLQLHLHKIIDIISANEVKHIEGKIFKDMFVSYLNFVAQSNQPNDTNNKLITEEQIINNLEMLVEVCGIQFQKVDVGKSNQTKHIQTFESHKTAVLPEIQYLLLWLYRRNNRIEEGIKLSKTFEKDRFSDPRFSHGTGMLYVARLYDGIINNKFVEDDAFTAREYLMMAKDGYIKWIAGKHKYGLIRKVIYKNIIAICNLLADLEVRLIEENKVGDVYVSIDAAKALMNLAKSYFRFIEISYDDSATYNTSELEIILAEIRLLKQRGDFKGAMQIIQEGEKKQRLIEGLPYYSTYVNSYFHKKIADFNILKTEVMEI